MHIELESATSYVKQQLLARPAVLRLLLLLLVWLSASVQQQPWQQQFKVGAHCCLHFLASSAAAAAGGACRVCQQLLPQFREWAAWLVGLQEVTALACLCYSCFS